MATESNGVKRIGIVGGGRGGMALFEVFVTSKLASISYVCDRDPEAPALKAARAEGIYTTNDLDTALRLDVDFLIEATGSERVLDMLRQRASSGTRVIDNRVALFLYEILLDHHRSNLNAQVIADTSGIKRQIVDSMGSINRLLDDIEDVTTDLNMLGLNARIEAARVGQQGAGFGVVASEIQKSAETVRAMANEIATVSKGIVAISERLEASLRRLQ